MSPIHRTVRDNYNLKSRKYVCITTYHPHTESNPNPNNPNPTTKQHVVVNIKLNIVTCPTYMHINSYEPCMLLRRLCDFRL